MFRRAYIYVYIYIPQIRDVGNDLFQLSSMLNIEGTEVPGNRIPLFWTVFLSRRLPQATE